MSTKEGGNSGLLLGGLGGLKWDQEWLDAVLTTCEHPFENFLLEGLNR
jgi:hypothetical protein